MSTIQQSSAVSQPPLQMVIQAGRVRLAAPAIAQAAEVSALVEEGILVAVVPRGVGDVGPTKPGLSAACACFVTPVGSIGPDTL